MLQLKNVEGVHKYVLPNGSPVILSCVESPGQTDRSGPALITGNEFTVTVMLEVFEHPLASVPVTIYEAVEEGLASDDGSCCVADRSDEGLHI